MKQTIGYQASFSGGMIDGVKQDVPFDNNSQSITSVLWLENYNHTLQQETAIKRWGEIDSGLDPLDLAFFCPNEPYDYVISADTNTELDKSSWLQGVQIYDVVRPQQITNYTCFVRRHPNLSTGYSDDYVPQYIKDDAGFQDCEAVAVVSLTRAFKDDTLRWQEVWADGILTYPGWYTFGSLADVTRYGETLLFTTTLELQEYYVFDSGLGKTVPNAVNGYLYPVYRYVYWDIRKKQEAGNQFLRGLADYADLTGDEYAKWKVLPPAQSLTNLEVGMVKGVQDGVTHDNVDGSTAAYDINLVIEECVYVGSRSEYVFDGTTGYNITNIYQPIWITQEYYRAKALVALTATYTEFLVPTNTVMSIGELDSNLLNTKIFGKYDEHEIESDVVTNYNILRRKSAVPVYSLGTQKDVIALIYGTKETPAGNNRLYTASPVMEKYTEAQAPRLFLYKEEVEFIVTANVNGVDVLLYRGTYVVKTEPTVLPIYGGTDYRTDYYLFPQLVNRQDPLSNYPIYESELSSYNSITLQQEELTVGISHYVSNHWYNYSGYQNKYYESLLYTTLEIGVEAMEKLIDSNCSSLSVWAIKPDSNRHLFKSIGMTMDSPSGNIYNKPQIQSNEVVDYTKYALIKKYVIDGQTEPAVSHNNWNRNPLATNAWFKRHDIGIPTVRNERDFYTAIPLKSKEDGGDIMSTLPYFPNKANIDLYLDGSSASMFDDAWWTPDFVIWDYPTETTLFLNSSGKYWKGLGARLVTVIKGRTFIGGCIGADGIEEQAILRYSDVQGGAISPDIFSEERKIQVGHKPHTALLEFREQLWAFSRNQFYRINMQSITDETTWEFSDVVEQGTFSNKSMVVVPYGVCFCNESGVWVSTGVAAENIGIPVLPTYQSMSTGATYIYTNLNEFAGTPFINEQGINPYLEMSYDALADELIIYTPLFQAIPGGLDIPFDQYSALVDFNLIFSFKKQSWRVESSLVPAYLATTE